MEYENKYASKGVAGTGLGLGIAGTALGLLAGTGGLNILGNNCGCNHGGGDNTMVNRYEATQSARIAELETEVKLRDSNIYTDNKILALYQYVDGKIQGIEGQICQQNVLNAQVTANIACMQGAINTLQGLTKTIIPIDNVCPAPMPQYNSWTAPTTTA